MTEYILASTPPSNHPGWDLFQSLASMDVDSFPEDELREFTENAGLPVSLVDDLISLGSLEPTESPGA
ncbi:hypothetical protein FV139_20580 [Parahaliea maris]|uniref:Uncharacterized protein n=1 Tax=Parahaliea maris TaxID=2716870 RepID=A0A5C8ZNE7_9GAMM|nr:hypothetical protein [Parahaliea maris]TXS89077.1 hypothetical protein FV139_20580 [Parahaliea maris]